MELWVWDPLAPAASEPGGGGGGGGGGGAYHVFMAAPQTLGPQPPLADWFARVSRPAPPLPEHHAGAL